MTWFTGPVGIDEDTSDTTYVRIYNQNGGSLPSSVTITSGGTTTFPAKSLAGPWDNQTKPKDAKIKTTTYPVWEVLPILQWTNDLGQVHSKSSGVVCDWLESIIKDMWTTSGDLGTVLGKVDKYTEGYVSGAYGETALNHVSPSNIKINPYFTTARLNSSRSVSCSQPNCPKSVNYTVIHEARHCYQDYLSSVDLGQPDDIAGKPNNDDDQDWLMDTVPIAPSSYILDTATSRATCSGNKSFSGDATLDSWQGNVVEAIEKDAFEYATAND